MTEKLKEDLTYANSILDGECRDNFRKIYTSTNESLLALFKKIDLSNKNVLTVLSSSDYLYMSYLFGAKNVDTFDINPLTYRFYHLRKWLIKNQVLDIGLSSYAETLKIIENTTSCSSLDEKESLLFWREIIEKIGEYEFFTNQLFTTVFNPFCYYYEDKTDALSLILDSTNPSFYKFDISESININIKDKYDVIFLSNILDYVRSSKKLPVVMENLSSLMNDNGSVICSHIPRYENEDFVRELKPEIECFNELFDYSHVAETSFGFINFYQYTRKK